VLKRTKKIRPNITHALLDFYDESLALADYTLAKIIILCPETCNTYIDVYNVNNKPFDLREYFIIDKDYYFAAQAPIIIFLPHSRLRTPNSLIFDLAF